MATETFIAEFVSISKGEGEERDLTNVQLDATADENYPGELKKVGAVNAPEIFEYSEKTDNMQVASNIGIETVSTVNKGHVGTSEGESFLESSSVSKVAHEETGRVSEDYQAGEIPIQAETEIFREETKLQKYKKLEVAEETGKVENEGMEEIKAGEEKLAEELRETTSQTNPALVQRALGETAFGGDEDKESEKSSNLMHKENDPEAEEKENESDKGKKFPSDSTRDVTMETVAASTAETTLQEAGVTFEEKSQDTIVLHEKVKDVILLEGDTQDQNKLDTPCVGQTKDTGLLKVDKSETLKEVSESGTDIKEISDEKNLPQVDLNEKIESEEAEILKKSSNEFLVSYPSVEEALQMEGDKPDDISKFEPQEQVHETNGVPLEEKKNFEEAPDAYKSTESLILEHISTEGEKASNTYAEAIDYGLDTEKESKEKNAGQNIEEEIQKKEEACDQIHKSTTRSIDAEKSKIDEDVSSKVSDTTGTGNEIIQKSFQVDYLDEAPSTLTSEDKSDKDDAKKDNVIPEEVHDEIKITGTMEGTRELIAGEDDATEGLPESIGQEVVKSFPDNEKVLLADEKSKGQDNKEQTIADNVKGTPESIKEENFTDNENEDEKCREEIFESSEITRAGECVESEKILDTSMVKPKESLLVEGENQVPIDVSTEEERDEHRYSVMDEDNDDNTGLLEVQCDVKDEMSIVKENTGWTSQKDETGEKLEKSLAVMSKVTETIHSSENSKKISSSEEERAIQDIEKEEEKDTKNSEERGTASEEDLKPVAVASEMNKSTESADLELKSEEGEMEVEKLERGNELGSEERFKGNNTKEEIEEEIKKEETYDADLHKVETTCDDTEKSKIEEDALIKDASTVWIGEEIIELSCQEDKDGRNGREKVALELNGGDHNVRTDNETESSTDQIISEEIVIGQGTEKHTINNEHITIDISPQSSGEERHKSSQEDETKEEEPKVEMCERLETTTVGEGIERQILEEDTIQAHSTVPTKVEETEDIPKYNEMMAKMPEPEVCETIVACQDRSTEFIEKDIGSPREDENKTSVDPCEKLEGAPESVAKDQSNETFLKMNETQDKENSNNVQDQKSESVVEEQNIEQGFQEDEKNKYEEIASGSDASDHEIQNENETTSERTVDISHSISEVSEEISKPIIQEAETCYNKLDTASKKVETEATCSWEAQPDEKPLKGTESTSEEKTVTTAGTSLHGGEGDSMKLEETTEFMSQLPAIPGENADKESSTMEKSHVDAVEEMKGDFEQCIEEINGTQKSLTVEYSEGILKEEIKGPSETVSRCNYQVVEAVIEDETNVVQIATTGESEEQHQETSKASLPKEQVDGIIATTRNVEDGKAEEGATIQNENLEDSFSTRTSEEICMHKEEPRELESGLGVKHDENIQNINPDEPPKEERITLDEVSQLEPQENVSAIKCSDSPTERDEVMELSEEVIEEAEKSAEESEEIKEHTTERDRDVNECFAVSLGDELVNKVQSETISDENPRATDSGVQIEQVNLEVMEDFSKDHEGPSIIKAVEEEMLQKQGSERKVDVASFESEISEGISKEVMEDADICSNNIDTASEKVETEDTRLQEAQLDHKHIKTIETGSEDKTLQTNTTPETSPQSEEVDSVKLEETPEGVPQCPVIACENTDKECEIVEKPHIDDVEEIKGTSESESESREQHVEGNDEIHKSLIVEESDEGIIKEEIKGSSETGSGCNHQGVKVVIEDKFDVVNTAAEEQNQETSKALLSEEQDHEITTTTGHLEDVKAEEGETPQNEDLEDSLATGTTEEICSQREEPRELKIFGLGLELSENIQNVNPDEPPKEECVTLDVVSQLEPQENISTIKCSDPPKESDKVTELPAEVPEGAEKAAEESENIQELIIEKVRDIKECPAVSNEDELVKAQYSETVSDDNPRATDSEVQTEKMNHEVVEDFSNDSEGSPTTKAMEEESGKKVDIYCCVSEISEAINKEAIEDADTCSNNSDNASQKLETEETRLQEAQMNDKHIKIIETSSEDKLQQANITIETSPQGEEIDSIKLEETLEGVSQLPPITCENTDERETVEKPQADEVEEVKGTSEIVSESREQFSEENDVIQKSLTMEESESIIKEEIRGSSKIVSGCNYEGVEAVVDEMDVSHTTRKSEEQHQETSRALLSAEQDRGIIATIECSDDGKTEEVGTPQNENLEDSKTTEETCLQKEEPRDLEISGVGIELSENIQNINPNEPPEEECVTLDEVSQLEPQENVPAIKCSDSPTKSDKVMELSKEVLEGAEKAAEESEDIKKLIIEKERNVKECPAISIGDESVNKVLHSEIVSDENARSRDSEVQAEKVNLQVVEDFSGDLEGSPVTKVIEEEMPRKQGSEKNTDISSSVSEVSEEINEVVHACSYNIDTVSEKVETEDTSLLEAQLDQQHIQIIETRSETSQLQTNITTETIDSLTEEALEEAEKAAESENIKKLIIEKEAESEEPAIEDESANKVQQSDTVSCENLGATDSNIQTEKANLHVVENFSQELEGTLIEKALEERKPHIQGSEKTVDISSLVSQISAETAKEVVEDTDACHDKLDTVYEKVETEETSFQDAHLNDEHIKIIETSSEDKKLQTNTTIETSPQGEEVDGVKIEETSTFVSQLPAIACENADKESEAVENPARDEVEETKGASDIESYSKEQQVEEIDETQKNPAVEESKDLLTEEIKGPSETVSQSKYQGVEEITEEKIIGAETAIAGKSEKQHQEASDSLLYEEQDHGISITIGYSEDGNTKEDETQQNESPKDSFATKKADYMHLQKEKHRELEISGLELELNENIQNNNLTEPSKEGCGNIDEVSPLDAQENVSLVKCTNSPVESDIAMELTKEVPEEAEKAVERENIKELIIEKEREIKELPAVSIDESVNKVQVLEPVSSENLGGTDPNMQTENLILEVEDLTKEPEGSPITKALEEEVSEKQNDQKAMDVPSSVSEMKENIKEVIVEKADISYGELDTESEKGETRESSLQEAQLDDKPLEIIETSSVDKTLQTNTTTETSQQTEEVDYMKLEETLELASQLPANECESTNKESETVEKPNTDELEETAGASETVPRLKEQCAEEIDENQKSLALEKSEEDITKEQIKQAFEKESEIKYQGVEAVIEEEIIAGQAIKADVPEAQLEEVSAVILSEEQEHGSHTTIGKSEDENIKEGVTGQYENPEDSFGTKTSEDTCLQKEEPRELDVSGPKEDGNIVDGVSQYEQQENVSELKYTDSPLGNEKVMEQARSIGSTDQEATKDDENMDSGVINNNPDVLPYSPGEEISQEEDEKCEEASNLECEHYEKASEPVSNPESAAIDEAVVGSEVGAHIHGSDTSNIKNSENLREKVPQGDEAAVESENIKELIIETERDIKDLPAVAIEDGTVHKDQHAEAVSNENLTAIACESADEKGKIVERPHADVVEEPSGTSDTVSESREQCVEKFVEIQESLTLKNSEENIIKEEIKGPGDGVSECTNQSFEAATENEATADQTIEAEKPEEKLQERSTALVSEEQEHGISTITTKLEDENTVENETPQHQNPQDSFGTKMTEERCLHKEESRDLEVYELELNNDVQRKTSSEEPKEGGNALYRITSLEPQEDAFEIKCTDSLAESDMELTRSMASTSQEASKDDEDLDPGISIKNVNDGLPPCSSSEETLQEVDEISKEASNLEGEEIEKASESTFQVQSAEVDEAALELETGSHSHGSEPSSAENNNPNEKNIELAGQGEKIGGRLELVAEDQCTETLFETNQTQVNGIRSSAREQNTQSIEEQLTGQEEHEKETIEETEGKLEFRDHINVVQNENVTTKDVILVEEVPEEAEIAEEKENIQKHIIEEKRDTKEHAAVSIEDKTVDKVHNSEPLSCEIYGATESNQETKEVNLEDEEDPCEKQADVSSSVFELSDKGFKGEILDEADKDNKLDTACEKEEAEKTILQEPQLVDEPLKGTETILEEKILSIINTTETSPGDEEAEVVKQDKTSDLVSQLQTTTYEHADNERIIVEKPQADEVKETKRASDAVSKSKDPCVEEIDETQRSLNMEKLEEEIIEEEMSGRSRTVLTCNQCVESILQDEITRESPETGNSEEQLQEMSTPLLPEEEHADKNSQTENLEDSLGTESVEEISLQKEGPRELEVSALAPKLSDVIPQETPNEVLKDEGQPQENAPEIKYMGSTTGSQEVMKLTRSINSFSQNPLKEEEILDSESYNNKADDFSITHSSGEILQKMQEQCEEIPILESKKIEKASESVSEVHYPEVIIKLEETEVKEEHLKTSVAEMKTEEIQHEKIEANEIIKNEISNVEIAEEKQVAKDYQPESLDKETIRKTKQGDELKNEAEHEELSEGSKKDEASENIEKQIIDEARTVEHPPLVSFRDESVKDDLPEEAKEERKDKETDIKLDLVNQSDETVLSEQADCSDIQLMKKDLKIADAHDDKVIVITKDDGLKPNLDVQPATRAAAEEASHQKEGDRIREASESVSQEPVHETFRCNEEIATKITDHSENIMEDNVHTHIPCELACNEQYVSEGLNLKDLEVNTNENGSSPFSETSWEEIPDKESVISEAERQHDLTSGEQTIAASMPTEEKGAKDEVVQVKDEGEHTKDEEPIEFSARGTEGKLEEAEIHSTASHKDGEIQDQIDKLNASSQAQDSHMEISEKEVNMDLAGANESTQDIKKIEKCSDETSQKRIPREAEPNESTEVTISSSKEEVQPVPQDLQPEVGSLESVNVSWIESGAGAKDMGGEKTMGDISEQPAVDPTPLGPAVSFSDLLQKSIKETLQAPGCLTEEKEQMVNKEDALAKEEEGSDVQEAETHEDRDQEEEGDEHRKDDSGSDAPIIVEASRDMHPKDGHKKSHNILSGVGSKVKHSIAKVKKAITGKSSHQKHSSPKGTATKVKEQK